MKETKNAIYKLVIPIVLVAAILIAILATLLATSRNKVPEGYIPEGYVPAGYISIDDMQTLLSAFTLPVGAMDMEFLEISDAEANQIKNGIDEIISEFERSPMAGTVTVNPRDWDRYASSIATENMTFEEKILYDRYDECCRRYLENSIDGYKSKNVSQNTGEYFYYGEAVSYDDLNLTRDQAQSLYYLFKFNNPQYYFLRNSAASSSTAMFPTMYELFADGDERARTTNQLFDKLDGWIESICDDETTTWQKELSANHLLCTTLVYDENEPYYQSLYSAVMLERTVCAGYSETFCAMMNAVGVDAMVALNNIHAWNVVKFDDGNYYTVDVLWNENKQDDSKPKTDYLNCGETTTKARDTEKAEHTYGADLAAWSPTLSQTDYVPTDYDIAGSDESAAALSTPANLRSTGDTDGVLYLEWDPVDNATGYMIEVYDGNDMSLLASADLTADPNASVNYGTCTALAVRLRAEATVDGVDYLSNWSDFLTTKTNPTQTAETPAASAVKLAAPKNVTITKTEANSMSFTWDAVPDADQYQRVMFKDAEHTQTWISSVKTNTSCTYTKLQPSKTYYCGIRAMKTVDGVDYYSDWTYFTLTTAAETASTAAPTKPAAPTNVKVTAAEETKATISWDPVSGATGYQVGWFRDSAYSDLGKSFSHAATETDSTWSSMKTGQTYYFAVRAIVTSNGQEVYSDWVKVAYTHTGIAGNANSSVAAPTNVKATAVEETKATISWDPVSGATGYQVGWFRDSAYSDLGKSFSHAATETDSTWSSMKAGQTYYFGVRAIVTSNGQEVYSDWVKISYTHTGTAGSTGKPAAPTNVKVTPAEETKATISWDPVSGATGYEVAWFRDSAYSDLGKSFSHAATETDSTWSSMKAGQTYYFAVRAIATNNGQEVYSDWVKVPYTHTGTD